MNKILTPKLNGFLWPNVFAITIIGITRHIDLSGEGVLIFSEFVVVPLLMGIISAWFWRNLNLPGRKRTLYAIYNILLGIVLSYIFLAEGAICLLIVSPLIFCFAIAGGIYG